MCIIIKIKHLNENLMNKRIENTITVLKQMNVSRILFMSLIRRMNNSENHLEIKKHTFFD